MGGVGAVEGIEAVVREPSSDGVEVIVASADRFHEGRVVLDIDIGYFGEPIDPRIEDGQIVNGHAFVGAEGGQNERIEGGVGRDGLVVFEAIAGVIGCADGDDVHLLHDSAAGEVVLGEHFAGLIPDSLGGFGAKEPIADPEGAIEFEMGPMIEGVAERSGDGFGPFFELIPIGGVSCTVPFGDPGRPHGTPFVVVTVEPDLCQILEAVIGRDLFGWEVAVVVHDRHVAGILVIESDSGFGLEQEVLGDEGGRHCSSTLLVGVGGQCRARAVLFRLSRFGCLRLRLTSLSCIDESAIRLLRTPCQACLSVRQRRYIQNGTALCRYE